MFRRHKDILPYEENRVRLSPSKENKNGYINASNLTVRIDFYQTKIGEIYLLLILRMFSSYQASVGNHQKFYIAAQSPLPQTVDDFWQMIWETDVYLVISLTEFDGVNTAPYYHVSLTDKPFETGEVIIYEFCKNSRCFSNVLK